MLALLGLMAEPTLGAQYCDGLRGPLVIYDPNDPHASLYDYDNGSSD
jgi:iron transport multicopper oxidase